MLFRSDEESQKLVDIIKDLNDTKKTVLKQILNLEIEINGIKEKYADIYYQSIKQFADEAEIKKRKETDDTERDSFIEPFLKDLNKTLEWQNWNLAQIQKTIELGAGDRKTALRWLFSSQEYDQGEYVTDWDIDGFLYSQGIVHSDFGKEVKKELLEIYKVEKDENWNNN